MNNSPASLVRDLRRIVGERSVVEQIPSAYLADATESRGITGHADALVLPRTSGDVKDTVAWCYRHDVPVVPRGGGTGFTAGAVPLGRGVVLSLERLREVRSFDPLLWRINIEAGRTTAEVRSLARENGLLFPPDPGAAEQSQIGGNVATNAGGPHAFKYGVTSHWVTGLEAVVAPGELITVGGSYRKDVAGYDLKSLLVGSEGTLGVITSVWLRLMPTPPASAVVAAFYEDVEAGCTAIESVLGNGIPVAALEFFDSRTLELSGRAFPGELPGGAFMVIAEVDGSPAEVEAEAGDLVDVLTEGCLALHAPTRTDEVAALWRWRDGVSIAVGAARGGKVSEDIVVPIDRLAEAIEGTIEIGRLHNLPACSWGHAGDGNVHSTFMIDRGSAKEAESAHEAALELFHLAVVLGGSISGEHGVGVAKSGQLANQWSDGAITLHEGIKRVFDPKNLLNPGKKLAR